MKKIKYMLFTFILCFISLNTVYAEDNITCSYKNGNITLNCDVSQSGVSCSSKGISKISSALKSSDFNDNGTYSCDKVKNLYIAISDGTTYISSSENDGCPINNNDVVGVWDKIKKDGCGTISLINSSIQVDENEKENSNNKVPEESKNNYENDERYISAKAEADKYCNEQDFANQDDAKCEAARDKMKEIKSLYENNNDLVKNFCKESTQGVFTTLGWVFFIIKILVPILLIVFGSIDFAKAVLASKDDEIKKSMKSLVMRAIAGIIIFFIPTILSFVVELINGNDIYEGSFNDCTQCMLNPNYKFKDGTTCKNLRGN